MTTNPVKSRRVKRTLPSGQAEEYSESYVVPTAPEPVQRSYPAAMPRLDDGAGFILGVFLWSLTLAYINPSGNHRSGADGVKDWLRAKFLNKGPDGEYLP